MQSLNQSEVANIATLPVAGITVAAVTVDSLLKDACVASDNMTAKAKDAAKLAAAELNAGIVSVAERVAAVVTAHATAFGGNHNVRAIFSDTLWLLAVPKAIVETQIKGEATPKKFSAVDSIDLSKHNLRDAAKQVREQEGAGRASGGGRKATTATASPVPNAAVAAMSATNTWFDTLAVKIKDAGEFAKIVALLELSGYTVAKKGKQVAAAKPAAQATAPSMATQLKDKILAAAQA